MTPSEWNKQTIPEHATRHALSPRLGCKVFYRDDVTPHQEWNGLTWCDIGLNGNCHPYSSPLNEEPYLAPYKHAYPGAVKPTEYYPDRNSNYVGD